MEMFLVWVQRGKNSNIQTSSGVIENFDVETIEPERHIKDCWMGKVNEHSKIDGGLGIFMENFI